MQAPLKTQKKKPIFNPEMKNTMSSTVGGAGEASQSASAPVASAGGTGAVMASVEGGSMQNAKFLNFLESIKQHNPALIESITNAFNICYKMEK